MAAEPRRHEGRRPYSAGDGARQRVLGGEWFPGGESPPPPLRRGSSLERGIVGAPPPLVRDSDHRFTAAEVEGLLAVRDKELLSVKRRLYRASKKNDALESAVAALKEEKSRLRQTVEEGTAKQDELRLSVSELEDVVKRKTVALKASSQRRERVEETAKAETAQARVAAELARSALEEAGRKGSSLRERAKDAETQVKSLERRLEVSEAQAAEAKRVAAEELAGRISAHERDRVALKAAASRAEEENRCFREKLEEALERVRQKQEAERQMDKVVRELQAWRERVASGHIVEISSSEAKRLRWSEEQAELMKEANANLRSQLLESGRLLEEAEHSFGTVTAGFEDARGTIAGLSARLDQKTKSLLEAERGLRVSKAEAIRLKKCVTSLQLGLSEEQRRVRGRERALGSTRMGMEALVRGRQEEIEAKSREVEKRRAAERTSANTTADKESFRLRAEIAEECSREMDAERRVLLQHLAAACAEAALMRSDKRRELSPSKIRAAPGSAPSAPTSSTGLGINKNDYRIIDSNTTGWRETIRSLLERAVSDWSIKSLFRPISTPATDRNDRSKHKPSTQSSEEEPLRSGVITEAFQGEEALTQTAAGTETPATKTIDRSIVAAAGHDSAGRRRKRGDGSRESGFSDDTTDVPPPLEVVRVYGAPDREGSDRTAGWRWDLALSTCSRQSDSHGTGEIFAALGLGTLGRSLRERGVRGEGARMALTTVGRLLDALLLTRSLAAQQCAQVRTELALALGRLSTRSSLVSSARSAARRASTCNRTLVLRLVDLELRCWRESAATAAASGNQEGVEAAPVGEDKDADHVRENTDHTRVYQSTNDGNETEGDDFGAERAANEEANSRGGGQRSDLPSRKKMGLGQTTSSRSLAGEGSVLNLSNVGVDDETLDQVARKLLRACTHGSHGQLHTPGEDRRGHDGSSKTIAVVPLARLLLRGNNISDAGALALVSLVKESPHLTELDLRDNAIGEKGKLALKKALTSSPWVHRVVSEDLCGVLGEGEEEGVGGLVLRGKRHPRSTATDRARAYAFERIPPSSSASQSRLDALRSIDGKQTEREDTNGATCGRAPPYGGSADYLRPGKDETGKKAGEMKRLSLMQPSALESSTSAPFAFVASSCKIDFRGCARRPLKLSLVSTGNSDSRDPSPTLTEGMSSRYDRRRGRRHRGSKIASTMPGRLESGNTGGRMVQFTPTRADVESTDLRGAVGAPSRRLRHTRRLKRVDRDDGCPHSVSCESQDEDGLVLLLDVSRRILKKAEGFEQSRTRSGELHRSSRTPARTHKRDGVGLAEACSVEVGQPCESRSHATFRAPVYTAVCSEEAKTANSSPSSLDRDHSPSTKPRRGIRRRLAPRRHNSSSGAASRIKATLTAAEVVEGSRGLGSADDAYPDKEDTREGAHPENMLEPSPEHSALGEEPAIDSTPALVEGDEVPEIPEKERETGYIDGNPIHHSPTSPQAPEGDDAVLQTAGASTQLVPLARKTSAVVVDAATWDEAQQSSDNCGWAYDEATSSWYAVGSTGIGDGQEHAIRGWRFDEQSATWHQDESVWQGHGPHEPPCIEASDRAPVTTEALEGQGTPGDNRVEHIRVPGDERVGATCETLLNQCAERVDEEIDEVGGLLDKRIKALELALNSKGDS